MDRWMHRQKKNAEKDQNTDGESYGFTTDGQMDGWTDKDGQIKMAI